MGKKGLPRGHKLNSDGDARWGSKRSRTGAGAPIPTPRSPRARRFRRARPLSCTPYRVGASDTATAAAPLAENAMQTDGTAEPMQPQPSEVAPASPPPPQPPILPRLPYAQRTSAHARQRLRRVAGRWCGRRCRYGARTRPPRPRSCLHRRSRRCTAPTSSTRAQRHKHSRFSTQPLSAVL